jgi:hypothetical protein
LSGIGRSLPLGGIATAIIGTCVFLLLAGGNLKGEEPFRPGETLTYGLRWGPFKVGTARLEVSGPVVFGDARAYRCVFTLRTNGFADKIYRVRDEYISYVDLDFKRTLRFEKNEQHRKRRRSVTVDFDWAERTARFTLNGKTKSPVALSDSVLDPLAVIFAARREPLEVGGRWAFTVTNGKRIGEIPLLVVAAESVDTPGLRGDSLLLEPDMDQASDAFGDSPKSFLKVWVSADARRIPVKASCRVKYGKFRADLLEISDGGTVQSGTGWSD